MQRLAVLGVLLCISGSSQGAPAPDRVPGASDPNAQSVDDVERGRYLATAADCAPCHAGPNGEPYAGGRTLSTPFGKLRASNITPDRTTGIGAWSDEEFLNAVRDGRGRHGEHLYPAMPYPDYTRMPPQEVRAIRAYLATVAPVSHPVEENQLPFPFRIRSLMAIWKALYFHPGAFVPVPDRSAAWNRGAYLVEGPGHCGDCHTPKSRLGGEDSRHPLAGGVLEGWFSPNLRDGHRTGLGAWSQAETAAYLRTGTNSFAAASGPMGEVIANSTSQLTDADIDAVVVYLKSRAQVADDAAGAATSRADVLAAGGAVYVDACASCHGADGAGVARLFPPLKGSPVVQSDEPATLIRVVLHGTRNVATDGAVTGAAMPAFGWTLSDEQVATALTYIRTTWGNVAPPVAARAVAAARRHGAEP